MSDLDDILQHYGVKGMKWGVRRTRSQLDSNGASRKTVKLANQDAKEYVRAKAFYGEGAGTRRKLIKQRVEGRAKKLPGYSKEFEKAVSKQDTDKAVDKAISKRKREDRKKATKQTGGAVARQITGEMGTKAAIVALATTGYAYSQSPAAQAALRKTVKSVKNSNTSRMGRSYAIGIKQKLGMSNMDQILDDILRQG